MLGIVEPFVNLQDFVVAVAVVHSFDDSSFLGFPFEFCKFFRPTFGNRPPCRVPIRRCPSPHSLHMLSNHLSVHREQQLDQAMEKEPVKKQWK
jgi:hypothetical protein